MPTKVTQASLDVLVTYPTRRVLWIGDNTNDERLRAIKYHLSASGFAIHEYNGDDDFTTNGWIDSAKFDLIIAHNLTYTYGDEFRATCEAAGVPYLLLTVGNATNPTTGAPSYALLTGDTYRLVPGASALLGEIVDSGHVITAEMTPGAVTLATADGTAFSSGTAVASGESYVGTVVVNGDQGAIDGLPMLLAIPAGTDDLDTPAVATTVNAVVWGIPYYTLAYWTQTTKDLLVRSALWALGELIAAPATPTLTATVQSQTSVQLDGSAFVSGAGGPHVASQLQVTTFADTTYATPVFDSGQTATPKVSWLVSQLDAGTQYRARLRYLEDQPVDGEVWSNWSSDETFTTDVAPATPTVSVLSTAPDKAEFQTSTFSSTDGDRTHAATEWEVTLSTDPTFASPIESVVVGQGDLLTYAFLGLDLWQNQYIARARHQDDNGGWSGWGVSSATGLVTDGQFYTAFAERPVGTDIKDDVPADWDEIVDGDESDWPIEVRADAVCEVVSHRSSVNGDTGTVDPIFWQGFPQVDKQIVYARILFEDQGGGGGSCPSGVQSPTGLVCRTEYGLLQTADFDNDNFDTDGNIVAVGTNGEKGIRFTADPGSGWTGNPPILGTDAKTWVGIAVWLTAGYRTPGQWAQMRTRGQITDHTFVPLPEPAQDYNYLMAWPELTITEIQGRTIRYCTVFLNWYRQQIYDGAYTTGNSQQFPCGRGDWNYMKVGSDAGVGWYSYAAGDRNGFVGSVFRAGSPTAGKFVFGSTRCSQYDPGWQIVDSYDWRICSGNTVTVQNLAPGWRVVFVTDSGNFSRTLYAATDGSDVEYDFSADAWPATRMLVYNASGVLVESWDVPTGIWGGDVYYINAGGLGVGPIGGAAVRLGP